MNRVWSFMLVLFTTAILYACGSERSEPEEETAVAEAAIVNGSGHLADFHVSKGIACSSCHANGFSLDDNESVQNTACVNCHKPPTNVTASDKPQINPHNSHLGRINCTTCHHGHASSQAYCANCHIFAMTIPFEGTLALRPRPVDMIPQIEDVTDIVVIGSGGAGLTAAITAHDLGAKVIVLEKQPLTGGNTMLSAGGMNAANTQFQRALGITDSVEQMVADTMAGGQYLNDPALVNILAANSAASVDWLTSLGVDLTDVGKLAGSSVKRSHRPKGGKAIGAHLISVLRANAASRQIDIRVNSRVVKLVEDRHGRVVGVHVLGKHRQLYAISAKAVVVASGGFSANPKRVAYYQPDDAGMTTSNQPGATGDGIDLGVAVHGKLVDMKEIQIHPTLAAGSRILITEAVRGNGGILVNREGLRFVNEMTTRNIVSADVLAQTGKTAFVLFDEALRTGLAQTQGYFRLGLVEEGNTLEELAAAIDVPSAALTDTISRYNQDYQVSSDHMDSMFQRVIPRPIDTTSKLYAIEIQPGIHYTMGGLKIDTQTQVMSNRGGPIEGFFAVGEVTGGIHGADRLGGNSISETITFGRIAGTNAAALAQAGCDHRNRPHPPHFSGRERP